MSNHQEHRYILSADIGQSHDYTALVVIHSYETREVVTPGPWQTVKKGRQHDVVHVERFRGIGYPEQTERIVERFGELERIAKMEHLDWRTRLVVDATGVGRPVLDMLRRAGLKPRGVLITGGDQATSDGGIDRVPKRELASVLQVALQSKRLRIAEGLPLAPVLVKELEGFRVKISLSGHATFGNDVGDAPWRTADHDDLVLATAIGVWMLEYRQGPSMRLLREAVGYS